MRLVIAVSIDSYIPTTVNIDMNINIDMMIYVCV